MPHQMPVSGRALASAVSRVFSSKAGLASCVLRFHTFLSFHYIARALQRDTLRGRVSREEDRITGAQCDFRRLLLSGFGVCECEKGKLQGRTYGPPGVQKTTKAEGSYKALFLECPLKWAFEAECKDPCYGVLGAPVGCCELR